MCNVLSISAVSSKDNQTRQLFYSELPMETFFIMCTSIGKCTAFIDLDEL